MSIYNNVFIFFRDVLSRIMKPGQASSVSISLERQNASGVLYGKINMLAVGAYSRGAY